jgi:hypothetical protein
MVRETVDGERTTVAQFSRHLAMVMAASSEALVLLTPPTAVVVTSGPHLINNLVREVLVWPVDGASPNGNGG